MFLLLTYLPKHPTRTYFQGQIKVQVIFHCLSYMYSTLCHIYHGRKCYEDRLHFGRFVKWIHKSAGLISLIIKISSCILVDTAWSQGGKLYVILKESMDRLSAWLPPERGFFPCSENIVIHVWPSCPLKATRKSVPKFFFCFGRLFA